MSTEMMPYKQAIVVAGVEIEFDGQKIPWPNNNTEFGFQGITKYQGRIINVEIKDMRAVIYTITREPNLIPLLMEKISLGEI